MTKTLVNPGACEPCVPREPLPCDAIPESLYFEAISGFDFDCVPGSPSGELGYSLIPGPPWNRYLWSIDRHLGGTCPDFGGYYTVVLECRTGVGFFITVEVAVSSGVEEPPYAQFYRFQIESSDPPFDERPIDRELEIPLVYSFHLPGTDCCGLEGATAITARIFEY